ncbi:hypothetical protein GQ53DRAFT_844110 [Thozetella sp. PMI_491]|nr:hypothetical protein GQ53DRAFT_844110 [Thozetella sp. PMI_491]
MMRYDEIEMWYKCYDTQRNWFQLPQSSARQAGICMYYPDFDGKKRDDQRSFLGAFDNEAQTWWNSRGGADHVGDYPDTGTDLGLPAPPTSVRPLMALPLLANSLQTHLDFAQGIFAANTSLLFPYEESQLTEGALHGLEVSQRKYFGFGDTAEPLVNKSRTCKVFPGDADWPNDSVWKLFNGTLGGSLLKPVPAASVCYNNTEFKNFSPSKCQNISASWNDAYSHEEDPIEVYVTGPEGNTCLPPTIDGARNSCTQGGYAVYSVNVSTVKDIQLAINFARNTGVRLVIKNTGHDFSGKSTGAGALSIWTHHLSEIKFLANYTTTGYAGPAFHVGAGVQAENIYQAAHELGMRVVGGICNTVGIYGGYSQGGGHSLLGSTHGMGADQVLAVNIVTPDGKFITASPTENQDLFWAIRGGGGSTFGVVTSMIVKTYKDAPSTFASFVFGMNENNITMDTFWNGVKVFHSHLGEWADAGVGSQWMYFPMGDFAPTPSGTPRLLSDPIVGPGFSVSKLTEVLAPFVHEMAGLGIKVNVTYTQFPSYVEGFFKSFPPHQTNMGNSHYAYASRLLPRAASDMNKALNATIAALRMLGRDHIFNGFNLGPTLAVAKPVAPNAVLPAWRDALAHLLVFTVWPGNTTVAEQRPIIPQFNEEFQPLRDATPGSGSYMNEAARTEPDFKASFYGANYDRLLEIKTKVDPWDVFWAATAVGSDRWQVKSVDDLPNENGKLCRI